LSLPTNQFLEELATLSLCEFDRRIKPLSIYETVVNRLFDEILAPRNDVPQGRTYDWSKTHGVDMNDTSKLTRQTLYQSVWAQPMTKVAAGLGISDVASGNFA
jgi:hypothetical protein